MRKYFLVLTIVTTFVMTAQAADQNTRTIVYDGIATEVTVVPNSSADLWITTYDLADWIMLPLVSAGN